MTNDQLPTNNLMRLLYLMPQFSQPKQEQIFIPQSEPTIAISERAVGFELQDTDGRRWLYEVTLGGSDEQGEANGH